jgi:glyoxylase-like metal-dependent hydrolase (beta-lactamase superfamily II)
MGPSHYKIHRISLVNVSCFLIYREGEAILVDSGNSGSEVKILETLEQLGLEPGMLRLLVLTHVHFDHAGSAAALNALTGCRIMVHRCEAERLRAGFTPIPGGTRWKAKLLVAVGRTFRRRIMRFPGTEPHILVEDSYELDEFGFPGRVIHTPGHTRGSMVIRMEGGELLAGDTLFGVAGKQHFPPFAEDLPALLRSWEMIRSLQVSTIYPAHGRPFSFRSFQDQFEDAMEGYA